MEPTIQALEDRFRCVAVDLRGHGQSTYNQPVESTQDFATDIKLFIAEVVKAEEFYLLGWSMGAAIAMDLSVMCAL